jgi:transposase-like protein
MQKISIACPILIVTDRETALMKALDHIFPKSTYLLCTWHVNMNILANCRKHFLKDLPSPTAQAPDVVDPKWEAFLKD